MLKLDNAEFSQKTKKVDVYSYAIVLYGICTGSVCFKGERTIGKISKAVLAGRRPEVSEKLIGELKTRDTLECRQILKLLDLMKDAWAQTPDERPGFEDILKRLEFIANLNGE